MRTHAIVRTHTRPMRERGAAGAILSDRGHVLVLIFAFLLIYREPASFCVHTSAMSLLEELRSTRSSTRALRCV